MIYFLEKVGDASWRIRRKKQRSLSWGMLFLAFLPKDCLGSIFYAAECPFSLESWNTRPWLLDLWIPRGKGLYLCTYNPGKYGLQCAPHPLNTYLETNPLVFSGAIGSRSLGKERGLDCSLGACLLRNKSRCWY